MESIRKDIPSKSNFQDSYIKILKKKLELASVNMSFFHTRL